MRGGPGKTLAPVWRAGGNPGPAGKNQLVTHDGAASVEFRPRASRGWTSRDWERGGNIHIDGGGTLEVDGGGYEHGTELGYFLKTE